MTDRQTDATQESDDALRRRTKRALEIDAPVPTFDATFAAAERQLETPQRHHWIFASAAAAVVVALAVAPFVSRAPAGPEYVQVAELMGTAGWTAPSDVLLPRHEIDLYRELPEIPESTKPAEGALL